MIFLLIGKIHNEQVSKINKKNYIISYDVTWSSYYFTRLIGKIHDKRVGKIANRSCSVVSQFSHGRRR